MLPESRARGYKAGRFSFNVKGGRCEACQGDGLRKIEMSFLPNVYVDCEVCRGKRYNSETLSIQYKGLSIADLLNSTVADALTVLGSIPQIHAKLQTLVDVGLGLHRPGPVRDDAFRRRSAADQARQRTERARDGKDALHSRRTHDWVAFRRREKTARRSLPIDRPWATR